MAYDPSDLRLSPWILWLLDALIRVRLPFAPHWKIGMTRAGALMFFSLLGLWAAAFYSGNNLLYLCGGMLVSIAVLACLQSIQILHQFPKVGDALPTVMEQGNPYILRHKCDISSASSAMVEVSWQQAPIHLHINMQLQQLTIMGKLFSSERACIPLSHQQLTTAAPLGLWQLEYHRQDAALWLVLPAPIAWTDTQIWGNTASTQRMEGDEYDDLRAYVAGDSLARIHWRKSTLEPETWRIKRFTQPQKSQHSMHLRVDLRCPKHASSKDFDRLLGMAWYWLKTHENQPNICFILGQQRFEINHTKASAKSNAEVYQSAIQALAQAQVEHLPPLEGEGMVLAL